MHGLSIEDIALYDVVGEPVCLDRVAIVPAFYELIPELIKYTTPEQRSIVANVFWKLFLRCQELSTFIDVVLSDRYDDYASVVMGNDFVSGCWNSQFRLAMCDKLY